jgi:hypothetical protein
MKTRLIFLVLLIVCFSCTTNNKPVSDVQKEKIKGEVKEVANKIIKGCEEANFDMAFETCLDSPDFVLLSNGKTYSYKQLMDMKPAFNSLLNQKCTIVNEKYAVLDNSTVLYTADSKWSVNYKDGHSTLEDPEAILLLFKKIDGKWKVTYFVDSFIEKTVMNSESSKEINQVELMKQFLGNWKGEIAKDTTEYFDAKSFGTGLDCYFKYITKGKMILEGKQLWGYDRKVDNFICSVVVIGMDMQIAEVWFTSKNICEVIPFSDIFNLEKEPYKLEVEFKSPDIMLYKTIVNNQHVKTVTYNRIK